MSSCQIYTVSITDIGSYSLAVAAHSETEAEAIAKQVLCEDLSPSDEGVHVVARELEAEAELDSAGMAECREHVVGGCHEVDFQINVPATSCAEAQRHAKRLYREYCGPYEFEHSSRTTHWQARAVRS